MWTFLILVCASVTQIKSQADQKIKATGDNSFNVLHSDGSYEFGYANPDRGASYHFSEANAQNVVRGRFGSRNPGTGRIDETIYTAGPRGFRPRGPNVYRKYDLSQSGPRPIGNRDDPYYDPTEDPSYNFGFRTRTYTRQESANRNGDVTGRYSYLDDIGERHNVEFVAGKNIGFHVKTPFPDSNPRAYGPLYYTGPGKKPRGHTSIQRGLDGSYRFVAAGPDQRRTETSDSIGNVRGSYTYLDDQGKQHSVHYIAGPNIGYRVLKNPKDYPTLFPFARPLIPSVTSSIDPYNEILPALDESIFKDSDEKLNTAASGHVKPRPNRPRPQRPPQPDIGGFDQKDEGDTFDSSDSAHDDLFGSTFGSDSGPSTSAGRPSRPNLDSDTDSKPPGGLPRPGGDNFDLNDEKDDLDIFDDGTGGFGGRPSFESKPHGSKKPATGFPPGDSIVPPKFPSEDQGRLPDEEKRPGDLSEHESFPPSDSIRPPRPPISTGFADETPTGSFDDSFGTGPDKDSGTSINISGSDIPPKDGDLNESGGTILRNLGSTNVNLPPGVAVRAHVQSIDILPFGSRLPSPSDQLEIDTKSKNS